MGTSEEYVISENATEDEVIRVIQSCKNSDHLKGAMEYIKLWLARDSQKLMSLKIAAIISDKLEELRILK